MVIVGLGLPVTILIQHDRRIIIHHNYVQNAFRCMLSKVFPKLSYSYPFKDVTYSVLNFQIFVNKVFAVQEVMCYKRDIGL